jgi:hypothetical protein
MVSVAMLYLSIWIATIIWFQPNIHKTAAHFTLQRDPCRDQEPGALGRRSSASFGFAGDPLVKILCVTLQRGTSLLTLRLIV